MHDQASSDLPSRQLITLLLKVHPEVAMHIVEGLVSGLLAGGEEVHKLVVEKRSIRL